MALNFTGHAAFAGMAMALEFTKQALDKSPRALEFTAKAAALDTSPRALEFTKQALDFTTALALAAVGGLGSGLETGCS